MGIVEMLVKLYEMVKNLYIKGINLEPIILKK